jgi:hypothetical protein
MISKKKKKNFKDIVAEPNLFKQSLGAMIST